MSAGGPYPFLGWQRGRALQQLEVRTIPSGCCELASQLACDNVVVLPESSPLTFRLAMERPLEGGLPAIWQDPDAIKVEWSFGLERRQTTTPARAALVDHELGIWTAVVPRWSRLRARLIFHESLADSANQIAGHTGIYFDTLPTGVPQ